jgi:hypothetical protein
VSKQRKLVAETSTLFIATDDGESGFPTTPASFSQIMLQNAIEIAPEIKSKKITKRPHGGNSVHHSTTRQRATMKTVIPLPNYVSMAEFKESWLFKVLNISHLNIELQDDRGAVPRGVLENLLSLEYNSEQVANVNITFSKGTDIVHTSSEVPTYTITAGSPLSIEFKDVVDSAGNIVESANLNDLVEAINSDGTITAYILEGVDTETKLSDHITSDVTVTLEGGGVANDGNVGANELKKIVCTDSRFCAKVGHIVVVEDSLAHIGTDVSAIIRPVFRADEFAEIEITFFAPRYDIVEASELTSGGQQTISLSEAFGGGEITLDLEDTVDNMLEDPYTISNADYNDGSDTNSTIIASSRNDLQWVDESIVDPGIAMEFHPVFSRKNSIYLNTGYDPILSMKGMEHDEFDMVLERNKLNSYERIEFEVKGIPQAGENRVINYRFIFPKAKLSGIPVRGTVKGMREITKNYLCEKNSVGNNFYIEITSALPE